MAAARNAALCFVFILVLFASHTSAGECYDDANENCWVNKSGSPLCVGFLCNTTCWIAGKMFNAVVKEHKCGGQRSLALVAAISATNRLVNMGTEDGLS